jgi:hypothetical protein
MVVASSSRSSSTTVAKDAAMHTAPDTRTDRFEDRRTAATLQAERFSPDENEGSRERRAVIGIVIPRTADTTRIERVRAQPDATTPILTP